MTLDTVIKSIPNTAGDKVFWGIHLPNLFWYSDLSSRNEKGRVEQIYNILSFLLSRN